MPFDKLRRPLGCPDTPALIRRCRAILGWNGWRKRRRWIGAGLLIAVIGTIAFEHLNSHRRPIEEEVLARQGGNLFRSVCAPCHGGSLQGRMLPDGSVVPSLVKIGFRFFFYVMPNGMEGFVRDQISEGAGLMPPFGGTLSERDMKALAFYIRVRNTE